jgi:DNA-directed RNA polymerase specialized sigma24 family protein
MEVAAPSSHASDALADMARLFATHHRSLVSMADAITRSRAEAEEVVQEAFIKVNGRDTIGVEKPLGYIYGTVHNLALDCPRAAQFGTARRWIRRAASKPVRLQTVSLSR